MSLTNKGMIAWSSSFAAHTPPFQGILLCSEFFDLNLLV